MPSTLIDAIAGRRPHSARRVTRPTKTLDALADEFREIHGSGRDLGPGHLGLSTACHSAYPRTALCLSGGGIRSAAFALGAIQWLAEHNLLDRFHYLSTVSGGGYTGAWLSAWLHAEKDYHKVREGLSERDPSGREVSQIARLRENSQYLTPRSGIASGDTWAAVAITVRNLVLNWLVIVPVLAALCLVPQVVVALYETAAVARQGPRYAVAAAIFYLVAVTYVTLSRARWKVINFGRSAFIRYCLLPGLTAAVLWSFEVASLDQHATLPVDLLSALPDLVVDHLDDSTIYLGWYVGHSALVVAGLHLLAWIVTVAGERVSGLLLPRIYVVGGWRTGSDSKPSIRFALRLSKLSIRRVTAKVSTEDRQAVGGIHYEPLRDFPVTFEPRTLERTVDVPLLKNNIANVDISDDDLRLHITRVEGAFVGPARRWRDTMADGAVMVLGGLVVGCCLSIAEFKARAWIGCAVSHTALDALPVHRCPTGEGTWHALAFSCLAVPVAIVASLAGELAFVAATSLLPHSDEDREWLGRASGIFLACGTAWVLVFGVVLLAPLLPPQKWLAHLTAKDVVTLLGSVGTISGVVTAVLGTGDKTPATRATNRPAWRTVVLRLAASAFLADLVVALSTSISVLTTGHAFKDLAFSPMGEDPLLLACRFGLWIVALVGLAAVVGAAVNVNRFSLHAMYRNRLIRAFLGASNPLSDDRDHPARRTKDGGWILRRRDRFTGFDEDDNVQMHRLWDRSDPPRPGKTWRPFHVINVALNVVSSRRLAWQERKAEPFVFTPLWCGAADLEAFRRASEYAGKHKAVTLGTAMAISGAALSPNMGYNSSPLVTLLLTLFNVRLGWWFGNPKNDETYRLEGPRWALRPLLSEALGLTTDNEPYVYLSDGGHFENLGLYEMVRRRCHLIVVCDAGHDPDCGLEDLANAARKISVDLGVRISFPRLGELRGRNDDRCRPDDGGPGFTMGEIDYSPVDKEPAKRGLILYVKPTLRGDEPADVLGYASINRDFPHDSTSNQWFRESQFESYRALAVATMQRVDKAARLGGMKDGDTRDLETWLKAVSRAPGSASTDWPT